MAYYPTAGRRGVLTEQQALVRWRLARRVYEQLHTAGPSTPSALAGWLGAEVEDVERACWWLTFADDNGCRAFVRTVPRDAVPRGVRPERLLTVLADYRNDANQ